MKWKYFWWAMLVLAIAGGIYAYLEYNRTTPDMKNLSPKFVVGAMELIQEFNQDEVTANQKYAGLNVIVEVNGTIKEIKKDEVGDYFVLLGDTSNMSSVRCSMDSAYASETNDLTRGDKITIKGYFNGFKKDETGLLGSDVELNHCVVDKK